MDPREAYRAHRARRIWGFGILGAFGLVVAFSIIGALVPGVDTRPVAIGNDGLLRNPQEAGAVPVFRNQWAIADYVHFEKVNDLVGQAQALLASFRVEEGTRVKVIGDSVFGARWIRILDGRYAGETGYTFSKWIRRP